MGETRFRNENVKNSDKTVDDVFLAEQHHVQCADVDGFDASADQIVTNG